jgi:hypothetical protein
MSKETKLQIENSEYNLYRVISRKIQKLENTTVLIEKIYCQGTYLRCLWFVVCFRIKKLTTSTTHF